MPFRNPIAAGVKLIRTALQSENYEAGVSGWSINRIGDAEFNDATIRGQLIAGGGNVSVTAFGMFMHSTDYDITVSTVDGFQMVGLNNNSTGVVLTAFNGGGDDGGKLVLAPPEPPIGAVSGFSGYVNGFIKVFREMFNVGTQVRTYLRLQSPIVIGGTGGIATGVTADLISSASSDSVDTSTFRVTAGAMQYNGGAATPFVNPVHAAGRFYDATFNAQSLTTLVLGANTIYWVPIVWGHSWSYDQIGLFSAAANVGAGPVTFGIYDRNSTTGMPDQLLFTLGAVTTNGANVYNALAVASSFRAGTHYWIAVLSNSSSSVAAISAVNSTINYGSASNVATAPAPQLTQARTYASGLPSPAATTGYVYTVGPTPCVRLRAA